MNVNFMIESMPKLLSVLPVTIFLSVIGVIFGLILAIPISIVREKRVPVLAQIFDVYISLFRGIPIIVQIYIVYYGLPRLLFLLNQNNPGAKGFTMPSMIIGIVAFALNASANLSEAFRSAYHGVDKSQYDAALSVGLTKSTAFKKVVIPQLIPNFIPNFTNILLDLIKDTALVYNIGIVEIMGQANILASFSFNYLEAYLDALVIYLVVCFIFASLLSLLENKIKQHVFA
ncbi:Amino acid ABC superfamily ATP binding cassette transporter, membrane protein [Apilactobacillus kunkeei]|uniref:amino acid ABC transporter permease n=1 Tax=Apilactobacillus kunkeei TaxID=148814 RepID=UPI0006CE81EF|nr:amino acid ABC transporter permease [Apilactobacillus kunkeei]KPN83593.1 Amino acid ABC superfamily ATP binding cassette transporter, membrane protein [Apilactobacillus kunkeei]